MRQGVAAAKANARAGLLLWLVAVALLAAYYLPGGARPHLDQLAAFKQRWGYLFAVCSTALWGALIPALLTRLLRMHTAPSSRVDVVFAMVFWGCKGAEVNLLYEVLARTVGPGTDLRTIAAKVAIDQLLYGPLWAVPSLAIAFLWQRCGYSFARLRRAMDRDFYETTALPMLLANWGVWIPTVAAIYALPVGLQLPMQNLVLCLWSLILATMAPKPSAVRALTP